MGNTAALCTPNELNLVVIPGIDLLAAGSGLNFHKGRIVVRPECLIPATNRTITAGNRIWQRDLDLNVLAMAG